MGLLDRVKSGISSAVNTVSNAAEKAVDTVKEVEKKAVEVAKDEFTGKPAPSAPSAPASAPQAPPPPQQHWYSGITNAISHTSEAARSTVASTVHSVEATVGAAAHKVEDAGASVVHAGQQVVDSGSRIIKAAEHTVADVKHIASDAGAVVKAAGQTVVDAGDIVRHAGTAVVTGDPGELEAAKNAITRAHGDLSNAHAAVIDARARLADVGQQAHEVGSAVHDAEKSIVAAKDSLSAAASSVKNAVHEVISAPGHLIQGLEKVASNGANEVKDAIGKIPGGSNLLKGMKEYGEGAGKMLEGIATGNPWKLAEGLKAEGKGVIDFGKGLVDSPAGKFVKEQVMEQVNGFNVNKQVKDLQPGETYQVKVGADVHVEVGGEAAGNLKIARAADGSYTINAGGNLGVNGYLEAGGRVNLGVVNGSAGVNGSLHGTVGGNLEMKCKTPEEAQEATRILEKLAAQSSAAGLIASGGQVLTKDESKFLKDHTTGVDLSGAIGGQVAGALGLDKGIVKAGIGASAGADVNSTVHLDLDHGKPTGFSVKQTVTLTAEAHGGVGVGLPGKEAPQKGASNIGPDGKKLPGASPIGAPKQGALSRGLQGQITDTITIETHYPMPSGVSAADFQKDPLSAIQKSAVELNKGAQTTVTVNAEGESNVLGKKNNIGATITFTGKPDEVLNHSAIDKAVHGDMEGAARAAGEKVQVQGTMYTYTKKTWGVENVGGDVFGVGVFGTLSANKRHVDDPPLVTFKMNGNEFVEAERRGLSAGYKRLVRG